MGEVPRDSAALVAVDPRGPQIRAPNTKSAPAIRGACRVMAAKDSFSRLAGDPDLPIGARPPREQGVGRISEELNGRAVECAQHATRRPEGRRAFRRTRALLVLCTSAPGLNHTRGFDHRERYPWPGKRYAQGRWKQRRTVVLAAVTFTTAMGTGPNLAIRQAVLACQNDTATTRHTCAT